MPDNINIYVNADQDVTLVEQVAETITVQTVNPPDVQIAPINPTNVVVTVSGPPGPAGSNAAASEWLYDSSEVMAAPLAGRVRTNAATSNAVTQVAINVLDSNGLDTTVALAALSDGDVVFAQEKDNASNWAKFEVSAAPTNNTTWFQIPVTYLSSGGAPATKNEQIYVRFTYSGAGGGVTDHGALTGLADDDHTQYALADGTRGSFASTTHDHDLDYDAIGTAASVLNAHEIAADPHSQYLTPAEGDLAYADLTHDHAGVYDAAGTASSAVATHVGLPDPHTQYQLESEKGVANGYASLDATTKVPIAQVPTGTSGTTVSLGNHTHSTYVPTTRNISSGNGLTGGGTLAADKTLAVGAGTGITVNADDVAVNRTTVDTWYDAAGAATAAVSAHELAGDPHAQYLTAAEGNAAYSATGHNHDAAYLSPSEIVAGTNVTVDTITTPGSVIINSTAAAGVTDHGALTGLGDDDHSLYALADGTRGNFAATGHNHTGTYDPAGTAASAVSAHELAADPHTGYQKETEKNAANGYAGLDAGTKIVIGQIPTGSTGTTVSLGNHAHAGVYEPSGAVSTHAGLADPHTVYQLESEKGAANGYASLDSATKLPIAQVPTGTTGTTVSLGDHLHGGVYDPAGTAASAISVHEGASNPHPIYLTQTEGDTLYATALHNHDAAYLSPSEILAGTNVTLDTTTTPGSVIISATATGGTTDHGGLTGLADDDHPQYQKESEKGAASGYASLDATTKIPIAEVPTGTTGTTVSLGNHAHAGVYDPAGTATSAISTHEGAADPHTGYQKESEKGAASGYASLDAGTKVPIAQIPTGTSGTTVSLGDHAHAAYALGATTLTAGAGLTGGGDLSAARTFTVGAGTGITVNADDVAVNRTTVDTWYEPAGTVATHAAAADPHTGYQKESEKGAASGYASLDASTKVPYAQLPTGTAASTVAIGDHTHSIYLTTSHYSTDNHTQYGLITVAASRPVSPRVGEIWVPSG